MKLSTYVNLRSIAWIVSDGGRVVANGIKRVMTDYDTYYEYVAGLPVSKRTSRRQKRSARRNLSRYKQRRELLARLVGRTKQHYSLHDMLRLRVRALTERVTPDELTAIMFSLQSRRGYKSVRGVLGEGEYLAAIQQHEENLKSYRSAAEYLLTLPSTRNVILTRQSYEAEFEAICEAQGLDDDLRRKLRNAIYFQRPLRRGRIACCKLERNRRVCHASHPDYQRFRILRDVNGISITDPGLVEVPIPPDARRRWAERLMGGKNLTKASCLRDLGVKRASGYSWMSGRQIDGNPFPGMSVELWQELFSATDDHRLAALLRRKYPDLDHNRMIDLDVHGMGWGEYSHRAITRLTPHLERGAKLREAIMAEYGVVDMAADPALRNLVLEQHFESFRSLIAKIRGQFDITESVIEISPLLKAGNKRRKEMARARRADAAFRLKHPGLTDYHLHLLKLHEMYGGVSPYEPGRRIPVEELFEGYNVDHIVPKSKLFEHGMTNQCLCRKELNERKRSMTGIEFARELGIEAEYRACVDGLRIPERTKRFLLMETRDIPTDYLDGSDYNTRCFATVAGATIIPHRIIARYQREWGMDMFPDSDARQSLERCAVLSNFDQSTVDYFNKLKELPDTPIGRYDLKPTITYDSLKPYHVYVPSVKFYRGDKHHPRFAVHDESILGRRVEVVVNSKGERVENQYFKVRKPVASLSPAMIGKVMDGAIRKKLLDRMDGRKWEDVLPELTENPIVHNGRPVLSVSVRVNATNLIRLPRGYAYSSMNHHYNTATGRAARLYDYLTGAIEPGRHIRKNDIIRYNGELYFVSGLADYISLRSVYELNAIDAVRRLGRNHLHGAELLRVDELGRVKSVEVLP